MTNFTHINAASQKRNSSTNNSLLIAEKGSYGRTYSSSDASLASRTAFQYHPYHLVDPSPWPLITSFALLTLTLSAVMYFNGYANGGTLVSLGFLATLFAMIL